ncbi:MAG: hypothetical protein KF752_11590 [Pirellulaceae bacterium]|nr:hypothetical protein [Pirellulaceae bacterium]
MKVYSASKPSHTLLLVTPSLTARADFVGRRRPRLRQMWVQTVDASASQPDSLTSSVLRALNLGPERLGKVSVLSSHYWTGQVNLATDIAVLANPPEILQALALEAELESGISALDCQVGYCPLQTEIEGQRAYCVTQVASSELDELVSLCRVRHTRLHRIAHPATIKVSSTSDVAELESALGLWIGATPVERATIDSLTETCGVWLAQRPANGACWIEPHSGLPQIRQVALGSLVAICAAAGCLGWNQYTTNRLAKLLQTNARLDIQQSQYSETIASIKASEGRIKKLNQEASDSETGRQVIQRQVLVASVVRAQQNARWSGLLDALAHCAHDCWVQRIESQSTRTHVHGLAPDSSQAHAFAARLELALNDKGWLLTPAATSQLTGGLCKFTISLIQDDTGKSAIAGASDIVSLPTTFRSSDLVLSARETPP